MLETVMLSEYHLGLILSPLTFIEFFEQIMGRASLHLNLSKF